MGREATNKSELQAQADLKKQLTPRLEYLTVRDAEASRRSQATSMSWRGSSGRTPTDRTRSYSFGFAPLQALSGGVVMTRLRSFSSWIGPRMSTEMHVKYGAPSFSVTFTHAVRTSWPLHSPTRSTLATSAEAAGMSPIRWSAFKASALLIPLPPPQPVAKATRQPPRTNSLRAVESVRGF